MHGVTCPMVYFFPSMLHSHNPLAWRGPRICWLLPGHAGSARSLAVLKTLSQQPLWTPNAWYAPYMPSMASNHKLKDVLQVTRPQLTDEPAVILSILFLDIMSCCEPFPCSKPRDEGDWLPFSHLIGWCHLVHDTYALVSCPGPFSNSYQGPSPR